MLKIKGRRDGIIHTDGLYNWVVMLRLQARIEYISVFRSLQNGCSVHRVSGGCSLHLESNPISRPTGRSDLFPGEREKQPGFEAGN
jgi:hypothetical protein